MGIADVLTENDERLIAKDIVIMLTQKGVSYAQAERILEEADRQAGKVPLIELTSQNA
ncbi:MAG: hypothetical protein HFI75_08630 [Lachnospiraceae bacterium]|nr:hypothetical protein [Lachnospiraceae bacterium]